MSDYTPKTEMVNMVTAREFLAEQKRLADAATEGPWERGDRWHIQGADFCPCAARNGPLVEERRMNINGEMMLAHVHRREEPWFEYGILSAARGRDGFPPHVVVETTEYGTMDPADAEFIAASRTTVPRLIAALEAVLSLNTGDNRALYGNDFEAGMAKALYMVHGAIEAALSTERGKR